MRVVQTRECNQGVEDVGTTEKENGSVHGSQRTAGGHEGFSLVVADIWQKFFNQVVEVPLLLLDAPAAIATKVRPGLPINAIDTDHTYFACLNPGREDMNHTLICEVVEAAIL